MKKITSTALIVALAAIGVVQPGCDSKSPDSTGKAGNAYIETEDGSKELMTGHRPEERTTVPEQNSRDVKNADKPGADEKWLTKFSLTERSGKEVTSDELKGQPYLVSFFFSTCPSVCPKQNEKIRQLQNEFLHQPVRFLSISCDPEVDRPNVLTEYAARFNADPEQWLFLTGDLTYICRVGDEIFRLGIRKYAHPEKFVLMNAEGKPHGFYTWSDEGQWAALKKDIRKLIEAQK